MQDTISQRPPVVAPRLPSLRKRVSWTFVLIAAVGASMATVGFLLKILLSGFRLPV